MGESPMDWKDVHEQLIRLATQRSALDSQEGPLLLAALRARVHEQLGYGTFQEYAERLFGYTPRFVVERLRVARALENLPQTQEALAQGVITWSAARELTRVATVENETDWLAASAHKSVRELEKMVSGLQPGAKPGDLGRPEHERHVLRFEVSAETYATYREAIAKLRRNWEAPRTHDYVVAGSSSNNFPSTVPSPPLTRVV